MIGINAAGCTLSVANKALSHSLSLHSAWTAKWGPYVQHVHDLLDGVGVGGGLAASKQEKKGKMAQRVALLLILPYIGRKVGR